MLTASRCTAAAMLLAMLAAPPLAAQPLKRIIGGTPSGHGEWPFAVSMRVDAGSGRIGSCTATLIHPSWVLTAAHCVVDAKTGRERGASDVAVQLESLDAFDPESGAPKRNARRLVVHPSYPGRLDRGIDHDIALIELETPVDGPTVRLADAAIAPSVERPFMSATAIGWGKTEAGVGSPRLLEVALPILERNRCAQTWRRADRLASISERQLCARTTPDSSTCNGDSGGPYLARAPNGLIYQIGLTSFGGNGCRTGLPAVFTRVAAFHDWIASHVPLHETVIPSEFRPDARALIVAIDDYPDDAIQPLKGSKADARLMAELYEDRFGIPRDEILILTDAQATRNAIIQAIQQHLVAGSAPDARLFFHFSGHGYHVPDRDGDETLDGRDEVLVVHDTSTASGELTNVVLDDELRGLFSELGNRRLMVTVDSCFSGTMTRSARVPEGDAAFTRFPLGANLARPMQMAATAVVATQRSGAFEEIPGNLTTWTAVSPSQMAVVDRDAESYRGVFTALFAEGLGNRAADANNDNLVTGAELLDYVTSRSEAYCARNPETCTLGLTPTLEGPRETLNRDIVTGRAPASTSSLALPDPGRLSITVEPASRLHVGERIRFRVESEVSGDFTLFELGPDGTVTTLLPDPGSAIDRYRIEAGPPRTAPDSAELGYAWFETAGPPGNYRLYAVVSEAPLDHASLRLALSEGGSNAFEAELAVQLRGRVVGESGRVSRPPFSMTAAFYELLP